MPCQKSKSKLENKRKLYNCHTCAEEVQLQWSEGTSSEIEMCVFLCRQSKHTARHTEKVLLLHKLALDIAADSLPGREEAEDNLLQESKQIRMSLLSMHRLLHNHSISLFQILQIFINLYCQYLIHNQIVSAKLLKDKSLKCLNYFLDFVYLVNCSVIFSLHLSPHMMV